MFEVFKDHAVKEEVRQMLLALKDADYAISDLPYEDIAKYAKHFGTDVKLRRLKGEKVKVALKNEGAA